MAHRGAVDGGLAALCGFIRILTCSGKVDLAVFLSEVLLHYNSDFIAALKWYAFKSVFQSIRGDTFNVEKP